MGGIFNRDIVFPCNNNNHLWDFTELKSETQV